MLATILLALAAMPAKETVLSFDPGGVAYLVPTPFGMVLSNCDDVQFARCPDPKLFLLDQNGKPVRELSLALLGVRSSTNPIWDGQHLLLADRATGLLFVLNGELQKQAELLLKGNHPHPAYPRFLAFAPKQGRLFVTGCYPLRVYLDLDCLQVHEYSGEKLQHVASSLKTKPPREQWGYIPLSWHWVVGVSPQGEVWAVQEVAGMGFRRATPEGEWKPLQFGHYAFKPAAAPQGAGGKAEEATADAWFATGVFFAGEEVLVTYASPAKGTTSVISFSFAGKAKGKTSLPGRVVGKVEDFLVAAVKKDRWVLSFYPVRGTP